MKTCPANYSNRGPLGHLDKKIQNLKIWFPHLSRNHKLDTQLNASTLFFHVLISGFSVRQTQKFKSARHSHAQRTPRDEGSTSDTKPQIACCDRRLSDVVNEIESGMVDRCVCSCKRARSQTCKFHGFFICSGIDFKSKLKSQSRWSLFGWLEVPCTQHGNSTFSEAEIGK